MYLFNLMYEFNKQTSQHKHSWRFDGVRWFLICRLTLTVLLCLYTQHHSVFLSFVMYYKSRAGMPVIEEVMKERIEKFTFMV